MWDIEEVVMWVLGVILMGICVVLVGGITFLIIDSVGIEGQPSSAVVLETRYVPESTVTSFITVGTVQVPQVQTYPESWNATVRTDGGQALSCAISGAQFASLAKGSAVEVGVGSGRMSGGSYCTGLRGL